VTVTPAGTSEEHEPPRSSVMSHRFFQACQARGLCWGRERGPTQSDFIHRAGVARFG